MSDGEHITEQRPTSERPPLLYYGALIAVYNVLYGLFLLLYRGKQNRLERVTPLDMTMLGLATLRVSKTISEDEITKVIRTPLVEDTEDGKRPRGRGLRWSLGKLVLCPTCTGTWVAAFLTYGLHLFPRYTRPFLAIMAASGTEQFSDALLSLVYTDRNVLRKKEERAG
jgi:hypothetical protein